MGEDVIYISQKKESERINSGHFRPAFLLGNNRRCQIDRPPNVETGNLSLKMMLLDLEILEGKEDFPRNQNKIKREMKEGFGLNGDGQLFAG